MRCVIIIIAVGQDCVTILKIKLKMTKESDARENIDRLLELAGWEITYNRHVTHAYELVTYGAAS
jgi:hypothetical protein